MKHLPNILSCIRIALVGVFTALFLKGYYVSALCVFIFAFFTDVLDGKLARSFGWVTNIGKLLDPFADKLMVVAALFCIYIGKRAPIYLLLFGLVAIKELLMVLGGILMLKRKVVVYADWLGKLATGLFAVGILLSLLSFVIAVVEPWNILILIGATAAAYAAMAHYAIRQTDLFKRHGKEGGTD